MGDTYQLSKKKKTYRNRIAEVMTENGYTVLKLTPAVYIKLKTNPHQYGQWVRNQKQPTLTQAAVLSELFNVDIQDLITII